LHAVDILFDHGIVTSPATEYAGEAPARVELGSRGPSYVEHAAIPGLGWLVWQVLDSRHGDSWALYGSGAEMDWYRLDVSGPAPWDRSPDTRFVLIVRRYAPPREGWWATAERPA
jgi:hypothetical protein